MGQSVNGPVGGAQVVGQRDHEKLVTLVTILAEPREVQSSPWRTSRPEIPGDQFQASVHRVFVGA
jgi:hypothetical protein